jgi:hypothetical protein
VQEVIIKITVTDANITLDGTNLTDLTDYDIISSIKVLVSLAKILGLW